MNLIYSKIFYFPNHLMAMSACHLELINLIKEWVAGPLSFICLWICAFVDNRLPSWAHFSGTLKHVLCKYRFFFYVCRNQSWTIFHSLESILTGFSHHQLKYKIHEKPDILSFVSNMMYVCLLWPRHIL